MTYAEFRDIQIHERLKKLNPVDRYLVSSAFGLGNVKTPYSVEELAARLEVPTEHVDQLTQEALRALRSPLRRGKKQLVH